MKTTKPASLHALVALALGGCVILAMSPSARADLIILSNNFNDVTDGTYTPGSSFDATRPEWGVASGNANTVVASDYVDNGGRVGVRSTDAAAIENNTRFAFSFYTNVRGGDGTVGVPAGAGWAVTGGLDGVNVVGAGDVFRILVGFAGKADDKENTLELRAGGSPSVDAYTFTGGGSGVSFGYTANTWYDVSFDLQYNAVGDTWTVSDLTVKLQSTQMTLASLASETFTASGFAGSVPTVMSGNAHAFFAARNSSTQYVQSSRFDNLYAAQQSVVIPEPGTLALVLAGAALLWRRRARCDRRGA